MQPSMNAASKTTDVQTLRHYVGALFEKRFARLAHISVLAPGRVNLIGEHTDYNDGFVFPMAIERYVALAAAPSQDARAVLRVYSAVMNETVEIALDRRPVPSEPHWANYLRGIIAGFLDRGYGFSSMDVALASTVPLGAGLSSSAALEVATATLLETVGCRTLDPIEKAKLCQHAEREFAGVPCGLMDQLASILGRTDGALFIDCRTQTARLVPLTDPNVSVLICNSNVRHSLADGEYGKRRAACHEAAAILRVPLLRDSTVEEVLCARDKLPETLFRRAYHVVTENARVRRFAEALENNDLRLAGDLMYQSHDSLRDGYEVSCKEIDVLVASAKRIGLEGGVYGSRITGGGFGGCTVSLVDSHRVEAIVERLSREYTEQTGRAVDAFVTRPSSGRVFMSGAE